MTRTEKNNIDYYIWNQPNNTPKEDDQNQLTEARVSDLQHIGTWIKSDPKVHEGNKTLITDERDACRPQEDRNADLPQTHDGQSDTQRMLERYMQQDKFEEPWKPVQNNHPFP